MPKARLRSGLSLHYQRIGTGPHLVLIHGLTGNLAVWHLKMVPRLRRHFSVLTYDMRGHGYSDMPPTGYTAEQMAGDLRDLLDALGIERAAIAGHSYGADAALYFAYLYPQRVEHVVAIEAGLPALIGQRKREDWEGWRFWTDALEHFGLAVPPERRCDVDFLLRLSMRIPIQHGPATGRPRKTDSLQRLLDTTTLVADYEVVGPLTLEAIPRVQTPVTLIFGAGSAFRGTEHYLREHLPSVRSLTLPAAALGHFGPLYQPDAIVDYLIAELRPALRGAPPAPAAAVAR